MKIIEERWICGRYCINAIAPNGVPVIIHGKDRDAAIEKLRRADPEPA